MASFSVRETQSANGRPLALVEGSGASLAELRALRGSRQRLPDAPVPAVPAAEDAPLPEAPSEKGEPQLELEREVEDVPGSRA